MSRVIIRTFAYNAEKTIERTIQSVLGQTHPDFLWYLLDNGSTDNTGKIINQYAKKDKRIIVLKNPYNRIDTEFSIGLFYDILNKYDDECFFCTLDSDDCYSQLFFEDMLSFMKQNQLDIAACASVFMDGRTNKVLGVRTLGKEMVIEGKAKEEIFPLYYQFMRTIWGKLYSFSTLRKCNFSRIKEVSYGNDTLFAMEAFRNAKRIGISEKIRHQYFVYEKSVSSMICDSKRLSSPNVLLEQGIAYLSEYGEVSKKNMIFLIDVYYSAMKDTVQAVLHTDIKSEEKLQIFHKVFTSKYARKILEQSEKEKKKELKELFDSWLFSNKMDFLVEHRREVEDIVRLILPKINLARYIYKKPSKQFLFLMKCFKNSDELPERAEIQYQIHDIIEKNIFTCQFTKELWNPCQEIIINILDEDIAGALKCYLTILEQMNIPIKERETFIRVGQYLAAALENQDIYILLKKQMISLLLEENRTEDAREELDDFDEVLPQDSEFNKFRQILVKIEKGSKD